MEVLFSEPLSITVVDNPGPQVTKSLGANYPQNPGAGGSSTNPATGGSSSNPGTGGSSTNTNQSPALAEYRRLERLGIHKWRLLQARKDFIKLNPKYASVTSNEESLKFIQDFTKFLIDRKIVLNPFTASVEPKIGIFTRIKNSIKKIFK